MHHGTLCKIIYGVLIIRLIPHLAILLELYIVANKEEIYRL